MIKIENYEVTGWKHAIRGMRNPMNSWEKSDSCFDTEWISVTEQLPEKPFYDWVLVKAEFREGGTTKPYIAELRNGKWYCDACDTPMEETLSLKVTHWKPIENDIGSNDHDLMMRLAANGSVHAKYRRMITVYVDITAPLYWWKEFDTYKVGTVANSCSTMHKIAEKEFELDNFSHEHLRGRFGSSLKNTVIALNQARETYLETKDKEVWWQMIQLLPSSYNQRRTVMLNYEVLSNIYQYRQDHKLDEWVEFCGWIETLPYSEIIIGENIGSGSKYMKKPVVVEAFRLGYDFLPKWFIDGMNDGTITLYNDPSSADIETLEGRHHASFGDYIIRGVKGEIYPCKPDIFAMTYNRTEETEN